MTTTTDDRGILNNLPNEPKSYAASAPTPAEQRRYWVMGAAFLLLVAGMIALAAVVS